MRRFLLGAVLLLAVSLGAFYLLLFRGFYLNLDPDAPIDLPFRTQERTLLRRTGAGDYVSLELRGVEIAASLPGEYMSSFAPAQEDYLRWLEDIAAMGANTVRVNGIMDDHFYNALYAYNTGHERPLYLLQGIQAADAANYGVRDAYHESFLGTLLADGRAVVDIIHGRRLLTTAKIAGGGQYWKDISPWVIGYVVGYEWNPDAIAYTDNSVAYSGAYEGEYFSTAADATPFEAMLAQVLDTITGYETEKYKTQRPIGFSCSPDVDFLAYQEMYARQLGKYAWLDPEHVLPTENMAAGCYASYRLIGFCEDFSEYLDPAQKQALAPLLERVNTESSYDGYLDLLSLYHSMPVFASCGFSSARGTAETDERPRTEEAQGETLMAVWGDAVRSGLSGLTISAWQDAWGHRAWNTAFAMETERTHLWHDLQGAGQNLGLLAFEPGEEAVCLPDGHSGEWADSRPVLEWEGLALHVRYDQEGLYLLIRGEGVGSEQSLYIPIDMTDELGSAICESPDLTFDRAADFLLCLEGADNSRLLVQERYDPMRMNFNYAQGGADPFVEVPPEDSARFATVSMAVENPALFDTTGIEPEELRLLQVLGSWETGRLVHGNGDPASPDYNSLADFCYGEDCVEIRLPWLLLNVADPTTMSVHRDYYDHYGVETERISSFWLGLGDGEESIALTELDVRKWDWDLAWRERLKESYFVVRSHWAGEEENTP